jgi:hypothetical protein
MASELIKSSAKILGGSAIAGIGFSFGRDIYKKAKNPDLRVPIIITIILLSSVVGTYSGGVWLARNYPSAWGSIFKRIGAALVIIPSFMLLLFIGSLFTNTTSTAQSTDTQTPHESSDPRILSQQDETHHSQANNPAQTSISFPIGAYYLPSGLLLIGIAAGTSQRKKRTTTWEIEEANEAFMKNNGLIEHEDETIEDEATGQHYRIDHLGSRRITLFPIGKRGKRAYINIDDSGRYTDYTGVTSITS